MEKERLAFIRQYISELEVIARNDIVVGAEAKTVLEDLGLNTCLNDLHLRYSPKDNETAIRDYNYLFDKIIFIREKMGNK